MRTHKTTSTTASIRCKYLISLSLKDPKRSLISFSVLYAQDTALSTCGRFYALYNNCLINNNYSESACTDDRAGYVYCSNYTYVSPHHHSNHVESHLRCLNRVY